MTVNKNIKKKNSLLYTYFCKTDTGLALLCIGTAAGFLFCLFVLPTLIGYLVEQLTPQIFLYLNPQVHKYFNSYSFIDYWFTGMFILFVLSLVMFICYLIIEFLFYVNNDIREARIKQLLPVTKEEWVAIGIKTKEDIFDNLKCIFAKNKRLDLYDNGNHELSNKIKDDVLDSVIAGYESIGEKKVNRAIAEKEFNEFLK